MAAHQAPLSAGFSRQEHWSGSPCPSPMHACRLSHFSRVWLCATLWTAALQAPVSAGFSRQEYWSGLPFPSPIASSNQFLFFSVSSSFEPETQTETGSESELVTQSCPALCDPMDCSLPGSSLHGILQARILEWIAKLNMIVTWLKSQFSHPDKDQVKLMRQLGIHKRKSRRRIIVRGPKNGRSPGSWDYLFDTVPNLFSQGPSEYWIKRLSLWIFIGI